MIPKIIHYCWFGGNPIPEEYNKYIESWKKHCPDYEIIEWNESNYDITKANYMREAYEAKKWGFVPDYARLDIIYNHGGIYLDTDVELIGNLDNLLDNEAFAGFEDEKHIALGLGFGAIKGHQTIKAMRDFYENISFFNEDGSCNLTPSPQYQTEFMRKQGLVQNGEKQTICGITIYPAEYFCPKDYNTDKLNITDNTYSIHHFSASWFDEKSQNERKKSLRYKRVFGTKMGTKLYSVDYTWRTVGFLGLCLKIKEKLTTRQGV